MEKKVFYVVLIILLTFSGLTAQQYENDSVQWGTPFIKSLILPGLGEYSLGKNRLGRFFLLTEVVLVTGALVSSTSVYFEDLAMRSYASDYAFVTPGGQSDQFWVDIGNYESRDAFNAEHLRWREFDVLYNNDHELNWEWISPKHREKFRDIRVNRDRLKHTTKFVISAVVLNHVISAIDALYFTRIMNLPQVSYLPLYDPIDRNLKHSFSIYF
ncbi:MAG: hypothetical protein KAK01_00230 [Candidatus Marinimicrobia bacterium]|nr:hypothetical protein [Candidatus Neomarinimicrobiota bacterium]